MKLSIIIVNWNTCEITLQALRSVYQETQGFDFEVILIDNNSADKSVEKIRAEFPQVQLVVNTDNLGFGRANNQGLKIAKGEYIFLLNSDTIVLNGAIQTLVKYLDEHPAVAVLGPKLLNADKTFQHSCRRRLPNPLNSFFHLFGLARLFPKSKMATNYKRYADDSNVTEPAEILSGAAMFFRRQVYETVGGFDERFFMYGEDVDLCKRILDAAYKIMFVHTAEIIHLGGASSKKRKTKSLINFYEAMWIYYDKHYHNQHIILFRWVIWLGIRARMYLALLVNYCKNS